MTRDSALIKKLEALSKIELTPEERDRLAPQLDAIIGYIRRLRSIDVSRAEPVSMTAPAAAADLRADDPGGGLDRTAVLAEAPDTDGRFYRVPRIIER